MSDKISRKKVFSYINRQVISTSESFVYTGLSITIPAKSFFAIFGEIVWAESSPIAIAINSTTDEVYREYQGSTISGSQGSLSGYTDSEITIKVFGKWYSTTTRTNWARLSGWYEPS